MEKPAPFVGRAPTYDGPEQLLRRRWPLSRAVGGRIPAYGDQLERSTSRSNVVARGYSCRFAARRLIADSVPGVCRKAAAALRQRPKWLGESAAAFPIAEISAGGLPFGWSTRPVWKPRFRALLSSTVNDRCCTIAFDSAGGVYRDSHVSA